MPWTANKLEEQIALVHWANCLTMVVMLFLSVWLTDWILVFPGCYLFSTYTCVIGLCWIARADHCTWHVWFAYTVFVMLGFCITLQLGYEPYLFYFMMMTSVFIFYTAHWVTYCTGTLRFGKWVVRISLYNILCYLPHNIHVHNMYTFVSVNALVITSTCTYKRKGFHYFTIYRRCITHICLYSFS